MKEFKVKLEVTDMNGELIGQPTIVDSELINSLRVLHGISALDHILYLLIDEIPTDEQDAIIYAELHDKIVNKKQ